MDDIAYVYRHRRLDNNFVFYIGIGHAKNYERAFSKFGRNAYWKNIVSQTAYSVEILAQDISWENAKELEIFLILEYGRKDLKTGILCNMTEGGDGTVGLIHSEATINLFKKNRKGKGAQVGSKNPMFGKTGAQNPNFNNKWTETQKKAQSERTKGINNPNFGKKRTIETIEKISKANKGKPKSETHKKILSEAAKNKGQIVLCNSTGIFYTGIKIAAVAIGLPYSTLRGQLKGTYKNKTSLILV